MNFPGIQTETTDEQIDRMVQAGLRAYGCEGHVFIRADDVAKVLKACIGHVLERTAATEKALHDWHDTQFKTALLPPLQHEPRPTPIDSFVPPRQGYVPPRKRGKV